ncbi:cytochrome P450, partial [Cunninghamella echinulata]
IGNFENYIKGPDFHSLMSDLFGNGIFNANGNNWKIQRKTASHIFNVKNFRNEFIKTFIQEINYMMEHIWDKAVESKSIIDFHDIMYKLTLDSFILLGFGTNINSLGTKDKIPFAEAFDESQRNIFKRFVNPFWPITEKLINILMPWRKGMNSNLKIMNDFAQSIIKKRREEIKKGETHNDLLSRFIRVSTVYEAPFSDKELRDIILNFIIAGRDTTAQALSWTFYMLISHPTIEAKLFDEIQEYIDDEVLSDSTQLYETIKKMKYAHAIFYEVLRLYPSVPLNQKFALNDDILPDGTPIRRGECFVWSSYAMGRIEEIWGDDAKQFKPDRWFSDDGNLRHESQYKWTSFHAGPRGCLGRDLATLEALATIILLVRKYRFSLVAGQKITYQVSLTLPMKYGMKVAVEKR